ncbi:hypothetical protein HRI_000767900 [Hibiscus trionum]|uniref:VQ domain-containing protein n=1 Tax=Hibiscus trionum TaxID=183268 RepID=A0A9W7LP60_HIBTR|nr:hypothetical protein HRI_000767900 [Hibiscus trionum]
MENLMIKSQTKMSPSTPSSLAIHKDSQTISKAKPKIRIIHIFAPEIIKTDVANFRELVQRLTGKPPQEKGCRKKPAKKIKLRTGFLAGLGVKAEDEGMWGNNTIGEASDGGFLGDFDGFIQELGEFPLLPLDASHLMHGFQEAQLLA